MESFDKHNRQVTGDVKEAGQGDPSRSLLGRLLHRRDRLLPPGSMRATMAYGAFWSFSGSVAERGCSMVSSILIARALGKAGFGEWGVILSAVAFYLQFAAMGTGELAAKHVAEFRTADPMRAGRCMALTLVIGLLSTLSMALVLLLAARWMAESLYQQPSLYHPLLLSSAVLITSVGYRICQGGLSGFQDFRSIAVTSLVMGVCLVAIVVPLTSYFGLLGAVGAMATAYGAGLALALFLLLRKCRKNGIPLNVRTCWRERAMLWRYSLPTLIMGSMIGPADVASKTIVLRAPGGLAGLGGFQAATVWQRLITFVPQSLSRIVLPNISGLIGQKDHRRLVRSLWASIGVNVAFALIVAAPICVFSPWLLRLYGPSFAGDWDVVVILAIAGVLEALAMTVAPVATATNRLWQRTAIHAVWVVVLVGTTALLVGPLGARGFVWGVFASKSSNAALYCAIAYRAIRHACKEAPDVQSNANQRGRPL